jgi:formylmethanofuran dehydrogenase subunit E
MSTKYQQLTPQGVKIDPDRDIPKYEDVVLFHSHNCETLALWYRMSVAAMRFLKCGRLDAGELICIVNHECCGIDAVQAVTGCTCGNGNLIIRSSSSDVLTLYDTASEHAVRVTPMLTVDRERPLPPEPDMPEEEKVHQILETPDDELLICTRIPVSPWDIARLQIREKCSADSAYTILRQSVEGTPSSENGTETWQSQKSTSKSKEQA